MFGKKKEEGVVDDMLGKKVRDRVTGFTGIAVVKMIWLNGCIRYSVQPPIDKEGKQPETQSFDEEQMEVLGKGPMEPLVRTTQPMTQANQPERAMQRSRSGGDRPNPPGIKDPR